MPLGNRLRSAVGTVWRGVSSRVSQGISAWNITGRIAAAAQAAGLPPTFIDTSIIDQLAGMARGIDAATQAFGQADPNASISPDMYSFAPWSMDLNQFNTNPSWRAHVEIKYVDPNGEPQSAWRWVTNITDVNMSVGDLRSQLRAAADVMAIGTIPGGGVGGEVTGIGDVSLTVGPIRA